VSAPGLSARGGHVPAARFLQRGLRLLGAAVKVKSRGDGPFGIWTGLQLTRQLVVTLLPGDEEDRKTLSQIELADRPATPVWEGGDSALQVAVLRIETEFEGELSELSLDLRAGGPMLLLSMEEGLEPMLSLGELYGSTQHTVINTVAWGAPVFDLDWAVIGLNSRRVGLRSEFVNISSVLRILEDSPCWDEIARTHRLARTQLAPSPAPQTPSGPDDETLRAAVRWGDSDGPALSSRARQQALQGATLERLREARGQSEADSPEQRAIDRILAAPGSIDLEAIPDEEIGPFATAARWFAKVVPGLPDPEALERHLQRRRQVAPLRALVGPHFASRSHQLEHIAQWFGNPDRAPLVIVGQGGVGKSSLIAKFVLERCPPARFAWLDFDRPDLVPEADYVTGEIKAQLALQPGEGPVLVVLDSFETTNASGYVRMVPALDALEGLGDVAVLAASRAPAPLLSMGGRRADHYELPGLEPAVAAGWLVQEGLERRAAKRVVDTIGGVPLNLKLARDFLLGEPELEAALAELPRRLIAGFLFRRILRRLKDPTLKTIAPWAMVPRRLTAELLAELLPVLGEWPRLDGLFGALQQEVTLLEGESVLVLRADLRNTLLPILKAEDEEKVRRIDQLAAAFWQARAEEPMARAEAIYHYLRLGEIDRAGELWEPTAVRSLGGYTLDELPAEARSWLESQRADIDTEQHVQDLLQRGHITEARRVLSGQPQSQAPGVHERRRKVLGMLDQLERRDRQGLESLTGAELEGVVVSRVHPVLPLRGWPRHAALSPFPSLSAPEVHARLARAIAAVGRLEVRVGGNAQYGTALRVGERLFLTTRTLVQSFCSGVGVEPLVRLPDTEVSIALGAEQGTSDGLLLSLEAVVLVHPHWDVAVLRVQGDPESEPLPLLASPLSERASIARLGFPLAPAVELLDLFRLIYRADPHAGYLAPGFNGAPRTAVSFNREVLAGTHDAANLAEEPGAAIIDLETGLCAGVQFQSRYLETSWYVPAWELARDPHLRAAGVIFSGPVPLGEPPWLSAWHRRPADRSRRLEAYAAWREGVPAHALAVLEGLPGEDVYQRDVRDRELLKAAILLDSDAAAAAGILERLFLRGQGESPEPGADRAAIVATRLRLAVDEDAERTFSEEAAADSEIESLVHPIALRLIPTRSALQASWGSAPFPEHQLVDRKALDRASPRAREAVERLVSAYRVRRELTSWLFGLDAELYQPHLLAAQAGVAAARGVAAGLVGIEQLDVSKEALRVAFSALERFGLDPHPTRGWAPVVLPLRVLLSGSPGSFPLLPEPDGEVEALLREIHGTGTLGQRLHRALSASERHAVWVPGLFHLLSPLPLIELVERRFTRPEA
jgi:hypothetical protein